MPEPLSLSRRQMVWSSCALLLSAGPSAAQARTLPVVTSFSILADLVRQLGGERVSVTSLIGANQDAHVFQPGPAEARKLAAARLIVVNGLGFDTFMERLITASGSAGIKVVASAEVKPLTSQAKADHAGHGHGHGRNTIDPHAWQSVTNIKAYARTISGALAAIDPDGRATYEAGLAAYLVRLDELDAEIRAGIAAIPAERRALATTHDAFSYFSAAYGLKFMALQGISSESEPSAADLARIIRQIRSMKAPAVFLENVIDPRKAERIAKETGARIGGTLYSDSLSLENGPAPTYIAMMRHNLKQLTDALKP